MNLHDLDYTGNQNADGTAIEYGSTLAIKNAILFYLASQIGDYVKNPGRGGILERLLFKTMNNFSTDTFNQEIRLDLEETFKNVAVFNTIQINPIYGSRYYEVNIGYTISGTNYSDIIQLYYKGVKDLVQNQYTYVKETGVNLETFVTINLPSMDNQKLLYDTELLKWVWGNKYVFQNFSDTDSNFTTILNMINNF